MQLRRHASAHSLLIACLSLVLLSPFVSAVDVRLASRDQSPARRLGSRENGLFPFLSWLRDGATQLIFGSPSSSKGKPTPSPSIGALNPRYAKETVIRFNVSSSEDEDALAKAADLLFLDVWAFTNNFVDIRLLKKDVAPLLGLLPKSLHSKYSTMIPDLAEAVAQTYPSNGLPRGKFDEANKSNFEAGRHLSPSSIHNADDFDNIFFHDFQPLSVIYRWMSLLESMFPKIVRMEKIGQSYEGKDILALRVGNAVSTDGKGNDKLPSKTIVINGGLHAREWVASSTVTYLAWSLISSYGEEPVITKLLNNFTTVFIPVMNPDGYEYTWNGDRLWRKSRQDTTVNFCRGLDLDHSFGFEWDKNLPEPCSESYGGEKPFQAVEANELSRWAKKQAEEKGAKFVGFIDLHSYSQEILYPYAYSCEAEPPNVENLEELGIGIAKAIRLASGETYDVLPACEGAVSVNKNRRFHRIESGGGSALDWFYHEMHAKFSYQIKLRDRGSYGFLLPREEIIPTGEEVLNAIKYYADFLLGNNGIEKPFTKQSAPISTPADDQAPLGGSVDEAAADSGEWTELRRRRRMLRRR